MTSINHIAAGTFFTGFWCSFWNINIFSRWEFLVASVIFSLLPDIDHPKSPIGFLCYPLARFLDRKYGHRTITHSLLFLFSGGAIIYLISYFFHSLQYNHSTIAQLEESQIFEALPVIFFFAVLSHFILDMVTIQGIPLFYPVKRNPCVIPGDQKYRLTSGNFTTELVAFFIFIFMNVLSWDLYEKGFWTKYNVMFTTIEHLHFERAKSTNFTLAKYDFVKNNHRYIGKGIVLNSSASECFILINDSVFKLNYSTPGLVINSVVAEKTNIPYQISDTAIFESEVNIINKYAIAKIISGNIISASPFITYLSGSQKVSNNVTLNFDYNIQIALIPKTIKSNKDIIAKQLSAKRQALTQHRLNFNKTNAEYYNLVYLKNKLQNQIETSQDFSEKNALENEMIKINNKLTFMQQPVYVPNIVTLEEIKQLEIQLNKPDSVFNQSFTANLSWIKIPDTLRKISKPYLQ